MERTILEESTAVTFLHPATAALMAKPPVYVQQSKTLKSLLSLLALLNSPMYARLSRWST